MSFRRFARRVIGGAGLLLAVAPQLIQAQGPTLSPELQGVRKALDKYNDPVVAVHDGFYSTLGCISYPDGGGEGAITVNRPLQLRTARSLGTLARRGRP